MSFNGIPDRWLPFGLNSSQSGGLTS